MTQRALHAFFINDAKWPELAWGLKSAWPINNSDEHRRCYGYGIGDRSCPYSIEWHGESDGGWRVFACEMITEGTVVTWYDGILVWGAADRVMYNRVDRLGLSSHKMRNTSHWVASGHTVDGQGVTPFDFGCGAFQFMNSSYPNEGNIKIDYVGGEREKKKGRRNPLGTTASVMIAVATSNIRCGEELCMKYTYACFDKVELAVILGTSV